MDIGSICIFDFGLPGICLYRSDKNDRDVVPACWHNIPVTFRTSIKTYSWKSEIENANPSDVHPNVSVMGSIYVIKYRILVENPKIRKSDGLTVRRSASGD